MGSREWGVGKITNQADSPPILPISYACTRSPLTAHRFPIPYSPLPPLQAMADFTRSDRVAVQLRKEIAVLVHQAVRDHALPSTS